MIRRTAALAVAPAVVFTGVPYAAQAATFRLEEATIADINIAFDAGALTSEQLVHLYLNRIEAYDSSFASILTINPQALDIARELDLERQLQGARGPLHGIPVILKDNFDTFDLPTTAASLALKDSIPPDDAFTVQRLREAGAIIIAKSNLTEFASGGNTISSLGGQTLNPYDLSRTPGGSSGGTGAAIAANFATIGTGSDTGQSIRSPASANNLVGIRSTLGLVSRDGVVPLSFTQDIAGPITRTVADAAYMLDVMAGYDPADPITALSIGQIPDSYTNFLNLSALQGARLGVVLDLFGTQPIHEEVNSVINSELDKIASLGATVIPVTIPNFGALTTSLSVSGYEVKPTLDAYFASLGPDAPIKSLDELIASGLYDPSIANSLLSAQARENPLEDPEYLRRLAQREEFQEALLALMDDNQFDALVYPHQQRLVVPIGEPQVDRNGILAWGTGFPAITIPGGFSAPTETAPQGVPIGIEFFGRPFDEPTLIALAYAYEQSTLNRRAPILYPPLAGETVEFESVPEPGMIPSLAILGVSALGFQSRKRRQQPFETIPSCAN